MQCNSVRHSPIRCVRLVSRGNAAKHPAIIKLFAYISVPFFSLLLRSFSPFSTHLIAVKKHNILKIKQKTFSTSLSTGFFLKGKSLTHSLPHSLQSSSASSCFQFFAQLPETKCVCLQKSDVTCSSNPYAKMFFVYVFFRLNEKQKRKVFLLGNINNKCLSSGEFFSDNFRRFMSFRLCKENLLDEVTPW